MDKQPVIISTDPGIDDIAAITISLFSEQLAVKMLVPTWGNVSLKNTLANTLGLEKFLGSKIPVVAGAPQALLARPINAAQVHGSTGLGGYRFAEQAMSLLKPGLAASQIKETIMASRQKVTLLGLGPLTDFALLLVQYPAVKKKIKEFVLMGGSIGRGNYGPLTEFNLAADPEAAQIVFNSGLPIKMSPLEIGNEVLLTHDSLRKLRKSGRVGQLFIRLFSGLHEPGGQIKLYDPTAAGLVVRPDLFTLKKARVAIELRGQFTYGASVIDFANPTANALVATEADKDKFISWFLAAVQKAERGSKRHD